MTASLDPSIHGWRPSKEKTELAPFRVRAQEEEHRRARVLAQRQAEREEKRRQSKLQLNSAARGFDPTAVARKRAAQIAEAKRRRELAAKKEVFFTDKEERPEDDNDVVPDYSTDHDGYDDEFSPQPPPTPIIEAATSPTVSRFFERASTGVVVFAPPRKEKGMVPEDDAEEEIDRPPTPDADELFRAMLRGSEIKSRPTWNDDPVPSVVLKAIESKRPKAPRPKSKRITPSLPKEPPLPAPAVLEARRRAVLEAELARDTLPPVIKKEKTKPEATTKRKKNNLSIPRVPNSNTPSEHSLPPPQQASKKDIRPKKFMSHYPQQKTTGPMPLSVRREKEKSRQPSLDHAGPETRRCLDKRTARMRYARDFAHAVASYRRDPTSIATSNIPTLAASVVVRVRPLLSHEGKRGEFDAVSADLKPKFVTVHDCTMHADMVRLLHAARTFPCTVALSQGATDDDAYKAAAEPALHAALKRNQVSALFMFGQTGSGKTWTMTGFERRLAAALFPSPESFGHPEDQDLKPSLIMLRYFEICGKKAFDLLHGVQGGVLDDEQPHQSSSHSRREIKLVDEERGCRTVGATSVRPRNAEELLGMLEFGRGRRATAATDVNGGSSRSHAVCRLDFVASDGGPMGSLVLIDCAGTERNHDSMYHDAQRRKESAEINQSLYALKCCIRAANARRKWSEQKDGMIDTAPPPPPPFRSSALTRVLREAFDSENEICVVATVSPAATDAEHSVATLRAVSQLAGLSDKAIERCSPPPNVVPKAPREDQYQAHPHPRSKSQPSALPDLPKNWSCQQLATFIRRKGFKYAASRIIGLDLDGKNIFRMSQAAIAAALTENSDRTRATNILNALRDEAAKCNNKLALDRAKKRDELKRQRSSGGPGTWGAPPSSSFQF